MDFNDGLYNMYREVDELSLLNKLFSSLICECLNINNYLSNVTIENKSTLKDSLQQLIYNIENGAEEVKNLIKIKKGYPIYKIDDIELISIIKTKVSGEYKENVVIENVKSEINIILNLIKNIIVQTELNKSYEIINILSNISYELNTTLLGIS